MQKILSIILLLCIGFTFTACGGAPENPNGTNKTTTTTTATQKPPEPPPPLPSELNAHNKKALGLLGYEIDENNDVWIDGKNWEICDPDVFREYMFGTWKGEVLGNFDENGELKEHWIFDDSEEGSELNLRRAFGYYRNGDAIIFVTSDYQAGSEILWLDINESDILYIEWTPSNSDGLYILGNFNNENRQVRYLTKENSEIKEPKNGYMSRLRLFEIMQEYKIEFDMLFKIEHTETVDGLPYSFYMDGYFNTFPIYQLSETSDKFVFKSSIAEGAWERFIDVTYTIEKKNGGWERTIEVLSD
jgi:hypothetical protein